jgi:hypothetical protein
MTMKTIVASAALLLVCGAAAQSVPRDAPAVGRRAPLAAVDDVEPAVNVGERRVAIADRQVAQAPIGAERQPPAAASEQLTPPSGIAESARAGAPSVTRPPSGGVARSSAAHVEITPAAPPGKRAVDTLDLGSTSITGNQELPKVLYIVPWKKSDLGGLVGRPVNTLLDEVLAPIDPDVFERQLKYYDSLYRRDRKE